MTIKSCEKYKKHNFLKILGGEANFGNLGQNPKPFNDSWFLRKVRTPAKALEREPSSKEDCSNAEQRNRNDTAFAENDARLEESQQ